MCASGPAASSRVSGSLGRVGSPIALSPRAASDSGVEVSAALGDMEAPRTTGVVEPLTADFGRTAHSAVLPPELRVRLPALQDACSAAASDRYVVCCCPKLVAAQLVFSVIAVKAAPSEDGCLGHASISKLLLP